MQHYEARSALNLFAPLSLADIEGACPNWAIHWAGQRVPSRLKVYVTLTPKREQIYENTR